MNIIFLDYDISTKDVYINALKEIASEENIQFFNHPKTLLDHFKQVIIPNQQHIDLIISDTVFPSYTYKEFLEFFRSSTQTYSYNNFKLAAIPIIIHSESFNTLDYPDLLVDLVIEKPLDERSYNFSTLIKGAIKKWRNRIFDDLEVLGIGIDYDFHKVDIGYSIKVKSENTKILTAAFVLKQSRLPYLWLNKSFFEQESTIDELQSLINHYMTAPRKELERLRWESQLQEFFNRNPKFLFNDSYSKFWSEPILKYPNSRKHIKPDFVTRPIVSPELAKNWHVWDLKLPIQEFLQQSDFHKSFTAKFQKCLVQITDYKDYFKKDSHKENIERKLGFHPKNPKMTLVVGRRNKLLEQQDKIYERLAQQNYADIDLLTYDEILDYQKRELERLLNNKLF